MYSIPFMYAMNMNHWYGLETLLRNPHLLMPDFRTKMTHAYQRNILALSNVTILTHTFVPKTKTQ